MGNRHALYEPITWINPIECPYLHVFNGKYVPVVGFPFIVRVAEKRVDEFVRLYEIVLERILPPLEDPPQQLYARDHVPLILGALLSQGKLEEKLRQYPSADYLEMLHGAKWSYLFVETLSEMLSERGYVFDMTRIASIGRNKRIQHHRIPFSRF